ncbi:hypothetical protein E2320_004513 [Naja naja]|nr:hypothetical protein E2320_004513 [Naja naja]
MKQGLETFEGAARSVLEEPCETLCYPSAAEVAEAKVTQEELQRSARPKELTAWQTAPAKPAVQPCLEPAMVVPALLGALRQPGMGCLQVETSKVPGGWFLILVQLCRIESEKYKSLQSQ